MYILKNSLVFILRNKGRNILIGIIILVIACSTTVTLAIRNTVENLVKNYEDSHEIVGTVSFDRQQLSSNFKGGKDARKQNIEAFNNIQSVSIEDVKNYGESKFLKDYYYMYATSLNSDTLTKATDSYEYEVEDRQTSTKSTTSSTTQGGNGNAPGKGGAMEEKYTVTNNETTITITKSKERFESSKNLKGDFELDGYSSYAAMENFKNGSYVITSGEIISGFDAFECVINEELASLNELQVGSIIMLSIGAVIGSYLSKSVGNMLLQNEIESSKQETTQISNNFGRPGIEMKHNNVVNVEEIDTIDAVVDFKVVGELLGIGILLTLISSLASMISIQRFSPLTILKERS